MSADRITIADPAPAHCSGCFQQKPSMRHVDFNAAYDGPVVPALGNVAGAVAHTIDELILCEECLTVAARLIGLEDTTAVRAELDQVKQTRDTLLEKVGALEEHVQHLRNTVSSGREVERVMRPVPMLPTPRIVAHEPIVEPVAASSPRNAPQRKPRGKRQSKPKSAPRRQSAAAKAAAANEAGK